MDKINSAVDALVNETNKLPADQLVLRLGLGVINIPEDLFKKQIENMAEGTFYQNFFKDRVSKL
ncbi:hypothetical protein U0035_04270 [Niabella yanshanensis]|uniref:Uncharacterized protein n=1 Tax=Niabella yanshanensis TaxID=577386 RepID=A0ABZ0W886_9BACT|nr:hypothetical protein [Niabella yanshanensis]WQD39361.1 hypothetical protein U0035_04270 [Niabella yanshanensis]